MTTAYDGVQWSTVVPKACIMRIWRSVWPELVGMTVAPRVSAPRWWPKAPVNSV